MTQATYYRTEIVKLFRAAMKKHGIGRARLHSDQVKHTFSVCFRQNHADSRVFVSANVYCDELWSLVGNPELTGCPISQYFAGHYISQAAYDFKFEGEPDFEKIAEYLEMIVTEAIIPITTDMRDPAGCVKVWKKNGSILSFGPSLHDKYVELWSKHYGLD